MNRSQKRATLAVLRGTREWLPFRRVDVDPVQFAAHAARTGNLLECLHNNIFAVQVFGRATEAGEALQLTISRHDQREIHGWDDLQRIKNEVISPERVAIEVYPSAADVIDQANMRHLVVLPEGAPVPFSIRCRWE